MPRKGLNLFFLISAVLFCSCQKGRNTAGTSGNQPFLQHDDSTRTVSVMVNGELFTTYHYSDSLTKPFLFPVFMPSKTLATRGFPIASRTAERIDHPHHTGVWFNFGDVNGIDFWNNSYTIPRERLEGYGKIVHTGILQMKNGKDHAILEVQAEWRRQDGEVLLNERTAYKFSTGRDARIIDRRTTLTAVKEVVFKDNKEGLFAIRVARPFELPTEKPVPLTGAGGRPPYTPSMNNEGVNGRYMSSSGAQGREVWGTQNNWVSLSAVVEEDSATIAIFDHPQNPGYPAHWHARDYGLFSVNNLGAKAYNPALEAQDYTLHEGDSITFRHRILFKSNGFLEREQLDQYFDSFAGS